MNNSFNKSIVSKAESYKQGIIDYYSKAGMDYKPWSRKFNMHFGYCSNATQVFSREDMLDEMNYQVVKRLNLDSKQSNQLIDLGCGVGSSARYAIKHFANVSVLGITIVPWQIDQANAMTPIELKENLEFRCLDYTDSNLKCDSFDGAYAMESSCYANGLDKRPFLLESYRLLKPGARLVVADGFTKGDRHTTLFTKLYRKVCEGWALQDFASIDEFTRTMHEIGFEDIQLEEASWRVAPSVMFVPWVSFKYFLKSVFMRNKDKSIKKGHFLAPVYGMLMGLHRKQYGYYIVSARKAGK